MIIVEKENLGKYAQNLCNTKAPIAERVDSLFCIRSLEEIEAVDALIEAFHIE